MSAIQSCEIQAEPHQLTRCFFFCFRLCSSSLPRSLLPVCNVIAGALANAFPSVPSTTSMAFVFEEEALEVVADTGP
jgi:hypothetical protein